MSFVYCELYDFSNDFIDFLKDQGYTLGNKLGQGSGSVAYEGYTADKQGQQQANQQAKQQVYALVITPWYHYKDERLEVVMKLQERTSGTVKLHGRLTYDGEITKSTTRNSGVPTSVQIMDLVPWTLAEYMFKHVIGLPLTDKVQFVIDIYEQLYAIYEGLAKEGLSFCDLSSNNIGFTEDKRCVLIDLESLVSIDRSTETALMNFMIYYVVRKVFKLDYNTIGRYEWEITRGICSDDAEAEELRYILETHIKQRQ